MKSIFSFQNGMELHIVCNLYRALEESSMQSGGALNSKIKTCNVAHSK